MATTLPSHASTTAVYPAAALDEYGCEERTGMSIQSCLLHCKFLAFNTTPEEVLSNAWRGLSGALTSHLLSHLSDNAWHRELLRSIVHACCANGAFSPPTAPPAGPPRRDDNASASTCAAAAGPLPSSLGYASFPLEEQAFESAAASYLHFRTFPAAFGWGDDGAHEDAVQALDALFAAVLHAFVPRNRHQDPEAALVGLLGECRAALRQFGPTASGRGEGGEEGEEEEEVGPLDVASNRVWVRLVDLLEWAVKAQLPPARRMPRLAAAAVVYIKG